MQCGTVQAAGNEERLREEVAEIPLLTDKLPAIQNIFLSTGHPAERNKTGLAVL